MEIAASTNTSYLLQIAHDAYAVNALQNNLQSKQQTERFSVSAEKSQTDQITLSEDAKRLSAQDKAEKEQSDNKKSAPNQMTSQSGEALTEDEQRQVEELKQRDAEVRAHEQAHMSASAGLVQGGASFSYDNGPDGKRYAVAGEVSIDASKVPDDPQANLAKAQKIRRAALAPSEPSSTDRSVAASASRMEAEARLEMNEQTREQQSGDEKESESGKDYLASDVKQNERNVSDSYKQVQNSQVLEQRSVVDFYT